MATVAILGSGAVGLFYGSQLVLAGHAVRFWLRRDLARIRAHGLDVVSAGSADVPGLVPPGLHLGPERFRACASAAECLDGAPLDWLLVAVKTTQLAAVLPQVAQLCASPATRVVTMCNGIGIEERLAPVVGAHRLFAALAHVCLERRADGTVEHQAHGKLLLGHARDEAAALQGLSELIAGAGIACYQVGSLREARWRKLVWNLPYNGLSVSMGRDGWDTARIMADAPSRVLVRELMEEVIAVANADLRAAGAGALIEAAWCDEMLRRTESMGPYLTSTLRDWRAGQACEIDCLFAEPVARAARLAVAAPRMAMLLALLRSRMP
jgi:2-dehydropantoate 2-reductase